MSTLLKPAPMARIAVIGLKKDRHEIISILHEMNVMQLEPLSKEADSLLISENESEFHKEISDQLLRVRGLINSLPETSIQSKSSFFSFDEFIKNLRSLDIDNKVASLEREKEKILTEVKESENNIKTLEEFSFFPEDLRILNLTFARSYFGRVESEKLEYFKKTLETDNVPVIVYPQERKKLTYFVLVIPPHLPSNKLASAVNQNGVHLEPVPKLNGKPLEIISSQKKIHNELSLRLEHINNQLTEISKSHYTFLKGAEEQLEIENKKLEVIDNLKGTVDTFAMEGWLPRSKLENVKTAFDKYCEGTLMYELETGDTPPTLMENPKRFKVFESFIRFYSLPTGTEFDPTLLFGLLFPIFYGLMIGDVGYGLVILLVSLWVIRRVEKRKRDLNIMPTFLRNFAKKILLPTQMVKLAKVMIPGCIFTIILGFLFNLYFGFHLNAYLFSYLNNTFGLTLPQDGAFLSPLGTFGLRKLLLMSGYIGLGMVSLGLVLGILNSLREHNIKHLISKVGWLLFGWGIALIGLALINHVNINPMESSQGILYFALIFGGIGLMFYGEGVRALMELPSIISHILSYTRIVGILLASVILADVIDFIFLKSLDQSIPISILGIMIFIIGHLFNIILGVFEPGIQGARLIYVEFFSKFYHGGGRQFKPFGSKRRFTTNQYTNEKPE
ncbi:MAG TPA: V-type ATP synthase subunit I [Nitrososphaeraceae archaeon]|nr:V-type ATP synthase subunit I [Nitrososphaeraceae archaeon]